jgi:glycine/D-amino acid oxidase-like deaminating enzyme
VLAVSSVPARNGEISFWMSSQAGGQPPRPALTASTECDVAIVGAGMTGLWTAYYLTQHAPGLRVVVLEAERAGFGASGRNGGWLSHLMPGNRAVYERGPGGRPAVAAFQRKLIEAVDEVLAILASNGIDADAVHGGNLCAATTAAALQRLRARRDADLHYGMAADEVLLLDAAEVGQRIAVSGAVGGLYYPCVARVNPAKLVLGLARLVESRGVTIYEHTPVRRIRPGTLEAPAALDVPGATVTAERVLICTEGYSGPLLGDRRLIPVNSSMIATEPLTADQWNRIGWAGRECLSDAAHTFVYAQRTADDRIAIGGRGRPYRFGSGTGGTGEIDQHTVDALVRRLTVFFPGIGFTVAHGWTGVLGVSRDWCAFVEYDAGSGIGTSAGYAGHGVTAANLGARTLADLVLSRDTDLTRLPWVRHQTRPWEREPARWLGVHAMYRMFRLADAWEESRRSQRTSVLARFGGRLAGLAETTGADPTGADTTGTHITGTDTTGTTGTEITAAETTDPSSAAAPPASTPANNPHAAHPGGQR